MRGGIRYTCLTYDEKESDMSLPSLNIGSWLGPIFGFVVGLIPLILIHELGHFLMAKIMGVWAREFGIGYPPRITKLFKLGETVFTLNWIPFGGFVRLEGESPGAQKEDKKEEDAPRSPEAEKHSLYNKSPWKRILIFLGGPISNVLTAWLIAILIFTSGIPKMQVVIEEVASNSPAANANVQSGDVIVSINDREVETLDDVSEETAESLDEPTTLTLRRNGEEVQVELVPRADPPEGQGAMGVLIAGQEISGTLEHYSIGESLVYGSRYFGNVMGMTVMLPITIFQRDIPLEQARPVGVVGISRIAEYSVNQSIERSALYPFLNMIVLLSVSLGIFNLLPIPALDGGRILFSLIEALRGKALTPEVEERIHTITFLLLIALFIFITALDILKPISLP
jgi:regulator of sigma E protease